MQPATQSLINPTELSSRTDCFIDHLSRAFYSINVRQITELLISVSLVTADDKTGPSGCLKCLGLGG